MHELTQEEYNALLLEHNDFKHCIDDLKARIKRCESQQEAMTSLTRSVDRLTLTMGTMIDEQKELKADVKALKEAPAESFNYYKKLIIGGICTTVIGAILGALISLIVFSGA